MNIASVRRPIIPPTPPRAPDDMSFLGRLAVLKQNMIATWGQRAYEEDVIKGRFFLRNSFILNRPDAIRHVLLSNYENYSRTPAGIRMLRPVLGEGLLIAEGHSWTFQRRTLAPAFTPRATANLVPHMTAVLDETIAKLDARTSEPVDLREVMQRMTLEIAGRTMFSFGMDRHGPTLRNFVMEYGARLGAALLARHAAAAVLAEPDGFCPRPFPQALDRIRRDADRRAARDGQEGRRAAARPVRSHGRGARPRNRQGLFGRATRRRSRDHDPRGSRDHGDRAVLGALSARARSRTQEEVPPRPAASTSTAWPTSIARSSPAR